MRDRLLGSSSGSEAVAAPPFCGTECATANPQSWEVVARVSIKCGRVGDAESSPLLRTIAASLPLPHPGSSDKNTGKQIAKFRKAEKEPVADCLSQACHEVMREDARDNQPLRQVRLALMTSIVKRIRHKPSNGTGAADRHAACCPPTEISAGEDAQDSGSRSACSPLNSTASRC